ncbi:MAG: PASTA domain-containing protein [Anaerolineales bacterium]
MSWIRFPVHRLTLLAALALAACAGLAEEEIEPTAVPPTDTRVPTETPTQEPTATGNATLVPTATPSLTPLPTATPTATFTPTPLPAGWVEVPDVIGMHYRDARNLIIRSGLNFVYRDVLDLDLPTGTVLIQNPIPGVGKPAGTLVFLFRTFQAPPALVSEICYPLRLITTGGRLLYYVDLEQDETYEIRTDFPYGETFIFDAQMFLLDSFVNSKKDAVDFVAPFTARYVVALGPYSITQRDLDQSNGAVDAGCLYVIPLED